MAGFEQTVALLLEPYNHTALVLLEAAAGVLALALIAGVAAAIGNWRRARRQAAATVAE
jgi:hypothetical protein